MIKIHSSAEPSKISFGSLQKGLMLDMPLQSKYMKSATVLTDRTPNSNDGTLTGATVGADYTSFNGTTDYVRIPDSESLSPINAMSAFVWVKGAAQNTKTLFSHWDNTLNQRAFHILSRIISPCNKLRVIISDDGTYNTGHRKDYQSSITILDNTYHQAGSTFDAGILKLYVDGVEDPNPTKVTDDAITTIYNSTADVTIGCSLTNNNPENFFAGNLAKPRMYNRALTASEITLLFDKQKGMFL